MPRLFESSISGDLKRIIQCASLTNSDDPRLIAFTIFPGHGLFIAEKWDGAKRPFQLIWEAMDNGALQVESYVPSDRSNSTSTMMGFTSGQSVKYLLNIVP